MAEPDAAESVLGSGTLLGGRYRLLRLLGEGGMGRVFLAEDERDGGQVAVKVLTDDRPIPKAAQRFEREARSIARIDHPNVVRVTEVGESPRGGLFYVMEYLEGEELATTLEREGPMPWPRVRHIALQICGALQAAHEAGIVHRDLKLENCFRVTTGDDPDFVKILDFGVVKLLSPDHDDGERLTNTGATLGTPAYMAPELCRNKDVDHRVDVYALGVMLYELLTGAVPFEGDTFLDVALMHMSEPPPPLSRHLPPAEVPDGLDAVIERALAKPREDRFPSMVELGRALEREGRAEPRVGAREPAGTPTAAPGGAAPERPGARAPGRLAQAPGAPSPSPARRRAWPWLVVVGIVAAGLAVLWPSEPSPPRPPDRLVDADDGGSVATTDGAHVVEAEPTPEPLAPPEPATDAGSRPAEAEPAAPPSTTPSKRSPTDRLTDRQIDEALRRVQPIIGACAGAVTGAQHGERVTVVLRVERSTGRVKAVRPAVAGRSAVESCLVDALLKARFPRVAGTGTMVVERTIVL
jgi:hypothetical protein